MKPLAEPCKRHHLILVLITPQSTADPPLSLLATHRELVDVLGGVWVAAHGQLLIKIGETFQHGGRFYVRKVCDARQVALP